MNHKNKKYISKEEALAKLERYCVYQDRCHKEVRTKLLDLGIYGDDLEEIIVDLITDNFLNEERFAQSYARGKFNIKKWGRVKIKRELRMKNISVYCIKKGMQEIENDDYVDTLKRLLEKKIKLVREKNVFLRNAKLANYAIRKGYEIDLVWMLIKEMS